MFAFVFLSPISGVVTMSRTVCFLLLLFFGSLLLGRGAVRSPMASRYSQQIIQRVGSGIAAPLLVRLVVDLAPALHVVSGAPARVVAAVHNPAFMVGSILPLVFLFASVLLYVGVFSTLGPRRNRSDRNQLHSDRKP